MKHKESDIRFFERVSVTAALSGALMDRFPPVAHAIGARRRSRHALSISANATPDQQRILTKDLVEPFNAAHPKNPLTIDFRPSNTADKQIRMAVVAGKGPDIVMTPGPSTTLALVQSDHLLSLDDIIKKYSLDKRILGPMLRTGDYQGHNYALPRTFETMVLYYNRTLFDKKRLEAAQDQSRARCAVGSDDRQRHHTTWRCAVAVTSTTPGSAAVCTRAATFGTSPNTSPESVDYDRTAVDADARASSGSAGPGVPGEVDVVGKRALDRQRRPPGRARRRSLAREDSRTAPSADRRAFSTHGRRDRSPPPKPRRDGC